MTQRVIALRQQHPSWGGRKIHHRLRALAGKPGANLDLAQIPAISTITDILRRAHLLVPEESVKHAAFQRFERLAPNDLWQMDFKGPMASDAGTCHPLTVLDDHSRFNLVLEACVDQLGRTVQTHLTEAFRRYGLPRQMLSDNGPPWGVATPSASGGLTALSVWRIRLGVDPIHGRAYHPQTQGKEERFHRTLKAAIVPGNRYADVLAYQGAFHAFRDSYNMERPHEALDMATPASRYRPSLRAFPETLPTIEYAPGDAVRRVERNGEISFQGTDRFISEALRGQDVAVRPTLADGDWDVFFCTRRVAQITRTNHTDG
jgi:transposase InsO family protein